MSLLKSLFEIKTDLSRQEVVEVLTAHTSERSRQASCTPYKYFEGSVFSNQFRINKNLRYTKSFQPCINGFIEQNGEGTQVKVLMNMQNNVKEALIIFCSILVFLVGWKIFYHYHWIAPIILLIAAIGGMLGLYWVQVKNNRNYLKRLLKDISST